MTVEIKSSKIHQKGVFAIRAFKAGEFFLTWDTCQLMDNNKIDEFSSAEYVHFHPYDQSRSFVGQSPQFFVNHSCNHKTEVIDFADVAIKDISIGEEITSNDETDGAGLSFNCTCGVKNCRQQIGAAAI